MRSRGRAQRLFIVTALALLSPLSATPASADCSVAPNEYFFSRHRAPDDGLAVVTSAFYGTPTERMGTRSRPVYGIDVGDRVAGVPVGRPSIRFESTFECGSFDLDLGQRYLFVIGPGPTTGDNAMVIETFDPAWRSVTVRLPTFDGKELPVEPDALIARLRDRLEGLPPTDAQAPVEREPLIPLLLAAAGLAGAAAWFSRHRVMA